MCEPANITAGVAVMGAGISAAKALSTQATTEQTLVDTTASANRALAQQYNSFSGKQTAEADKAVNDSFDVVRGMAEAKSKSVVAAGEAGVSGVSFANIMSDMEMKEGRSRANIDYNYASAEQQIQEEKAAARLKTQSVIASTPRGSRIGAWGDVATSAATAGLKIGDAYGLFDKGTAGASTADAPFDHQAADWQK